MPVADITWALKDTGSRCDAYNTFDAFYDGRHPLLFATDKFLNAFGTLFRSFADNLCPTIVDAMADRLNISGFDGDHAKDAQKMYLRLNMARSANQLHRAAAKHGDAFGLMWPDQSGKPQFWPQHTHQCAVRYSEDEPGVAELGAKVWVTKDKFTRVTLYYEDHNERYVSKQRTENSRPTTYQAFVPFTGDDAGAEVANTWGVVPLFHFANCDELGQYGRSELADVVPLQNALNKAVCDMLVAMEFHAFPQRYVTGLEVEIDAATGKPRTRDFTPGADRIWMGGKDVTFGQFPSNDLKSYNDVQTHLREEIARVTGVPLHYLNLSSQYPSGEALKITEGRLVKKTEDRQVNFGVTWADAMKLGLRMDGTTLADDSDLSVLWKSAAPYNPLLDAETLLVKEQVGVSMKQALRELGYSDEQIESMFKENEEAAAAVAQAAMAAFTRNGQPGQASTPAPQKQQAATGGLKGSPTVVEPDRPRVPDRNAYQG